MLRICKEDEKERSVAEIAMLCESDNREIFILGGATYAGTVASYLREKGIKNPFTFVVDDKYYTNAHKAKGMIPFSEYLETKDKVRPFVFGIFQYDIVMEKREQYKDIIPHMYDFRFTRVNGERVDWDYANVEKNLNKYNETWQMLSDNSSRECMEAYLNAAVAGKFEALFLHYRDSIPYFNDKLHGFRVNELFDCGAYDGDSIHDFVHAFPDYKHIYAFEPDKCNLAKIRQRLAHERIRNVSVIQKGLWSETATFLFSNEGTTSSHMRKPGGANAEASGGTINVIKLDEFYEFVTHNSLIKMDIEGAEMEALRGAERIIRERHPALAVCVYHKTDDLISIPQYISSLTEKGIYAYFCGYQGRGLAELVFYAIPKD